MSQRKPFEGGKHAREVHLNADRLKKAKKLKLAPPVKKDLEVEIKSDGVLK